MCLRQLHEADEHRILLSGPKAIMPQIARIVRLKLHEPCSCIFWSTTVIAIFDLLLPTRHAYCCMAEIGFTNMRSALLKLVGLPTH